MGTICAPAYENIFMVQFGKQHFYPCIINKSILYLRYGIIMIWTGTKQELLAFPENLNSKHKTIKFEHNFSYSNIFFDTLMYKDRATLFRQLSSENSLISNHISIHFHTIQNQLKNIPYSQGLRLKTICSALTEYKNTVRTETKIHRKRIRRDYLEKSNR